MPLQFITEERRQRYYTQVARLGSRLKTIPSIFSNDEEFVLRCVTVSGRTLGYASKRLRNNRKIVLAAVRQYGEALQFASRELRNDRMIVVEAIKQCINALKFATREILRDSQVANLVVERNGYILKYVSNDLRTNKTFVLQAVRNQPRALKYASEALRGDRDIVRVAVNLKGTSLKYASEELRNDRTIVLEAISRKACALEYASRELRNDRDVVLAAVSRNGYSLRYASVDLRNDREIVRTAVGPQGTVENASLSCLNDPVIATAYLQTHGLNSLRSLVRGRSDVLQDIYLRLERLADCSCNGRIPPEVMTHSSTAYEAAQWWLTYPIQKQQILLQVLPSEVVDHVSSYYNANVETETFLMDEFKQLSELVDVLARQSRMEWSEMLHSGIRRFQSTW